MRRPHDGQVRDFGPGPSFAPAAPSIASAVAANDNHACGPRDASALPSDARAIIEAVPIAVNQSGRAQAGIWRLRFAERWRARADPLTGWTGGGDPLAQIELRFATLEAAEGYCRREGVRFEIRSLASWSGPIAARLSGESPPRLCCWPTGPHARCCGDYPIDAHRDEHSEQTELNHSALDFAGSMPRSQSA